MSKLRSILARRPHLVPLLIAAPAMQIILYVSAEKSGFPPAQYGAMVAALLLLAVLCTWILTWE